MFQRTMSSAMEIRIPRIYCMCLLFTPAVMTGVEVDQVTTLFYMLADSPSAAATNRRYRSGLECASLCTRVSGCTGFHFKEGTGCQYYTSALQAVAGEGSVETSLAVYSLMTSAAAACLSHDQFELVELDGSQACIRVFTDPLNGLEAREECITLGATVISVETVTKLYDFQHILTDKGFGLANYWVGLYDTEVEGDFYWDKDKSRITASDAIWDPYQPNGGQYGSNDQDCGYMEGSRKLQDKNCEAHTVRYVCEIALT